MENNNSEEGNENDLGEVLGTKDYKKIIVTEDYDQNEIEIVKEEIVDNDDPLPIEYKIDREISELDSASAMRDDNQDDSLKRKIYKQALNINNTSLVTPKMQRIHEGVSKVFGIDDPPPGFGLIFPKFYYLEQKRPQPMSPLKVWRGFNGNIYFEPIQLQKQLKESSSSGELVENLASQTQKLTLPKIKGNTKKHDLKYEKLMQKVENRPNSVNSKNVTEPMNDTHANLKEDLKGELDEYQNNREDAEKYFFSTYNTENLTNVEDVMTNPSMNAFMNQRKFLKPSYPLSINNESKLDFNPPNSEFILTSTNQMKKGCGSAELHKQAILPNLNAVRRHNIPLKGLAFREAKSRINFQHSADHHTNSDISQSKRPEAATAALAYYTYQNSKTLPEEYFRNFNINQNTIINTSYVEDASKMASSNSQNKKTVKEIFRGIRRGVTIMNHMSHSADASVNFSEKLELNRKSAKQRSTRENLKNLKILNVKGDRITSFEILNNVAPYSSGKKLTRSQRIEQSLNKTNVKPSTYLSASNMSFKSNISAQSLGTTGLTRGITFRNTTPEIS